MSFSYKNKPWDRMLKGRHDARIEDEARSRVAKNAASERSFETIARGLLAEYGWIADDAERLLPENDGFRYRLVNQRNRVKAIVGGAK